MIACDGKQLKLAKYLLEKGANQHITNKDGWNAFHISCMHGDIVFIKWLFSQNLNPYIPTGKGYVGFHIACMYDQKKLASWLLGQKLPKDSLDYLGNNALDLVLQQDDWSKEEKEEMCKYLRAKPICLKTKNEREKKQTHAYEPCLKKRKLSNPTTSSQAPSPVIINNAFADEEKTSDIGLSTSHSKENNHYTSGNLYMHIFQCIKEGNNYHKNKKNKEAIKCYEKALSCYNQNKEAIKCYEKTLSYYNQNKERGPHTLSQSILSQIYNDQGVSYCCLEKYKEAEICYDRALKIREKLLDNLKSEGNTAVYKAMSKYTGETRHNIGRLYIDTCKQELSIILLDAALVTEWKYDIKSIETQYYLAIAYEIEKNYQQSKALYEKILDRQRRAPFFDITKLEEIKKSLQKVSEKIEEGKD